MWPIRFNFWFTLSIYLLLIFTKFIFLSFSALWFWQVGQFATLGKSQVLGTIFFFSAEPIIFFQVCRPIFLYAKKMEIQVLDQNTMCIWSLNMMKQRVLYLWEFIILFIWNEYTYKISMGIANTINILCT